jgi:DNA invertase Pin-like site-specific DNA recombinase
LHALRIDLFLHQQGLDTTTPAGKAMFQMMGVFAEFERSMIQERVRAGLARARSEGKQLGRPRVPADLEKRILAALREPGRTEGVLSPHGRSGWASQTQRVPSQTGQRGVIAIPPRPHGARPVPRGSSP